MKTTIFTAAIFAAATAFATEGPTSSPADSPNSATEKNWTHFVGAGVVVPVSSYNIDDTDYSQVGGGLNLNYMGVNKNGLAVKVSWSIGAALTEDVKFEEKDDGALGTYVTVELGLGYGFVNTPNWTVAAIAMMGIEASVFESDKDKYVHEELGKVDMTRSVSVGAFTLGGDLVVRRAVGEKASVFVSVGGRWVPVAVSIHTVEYDNDDFNRVDNIKSQDSDGGFTIVPTVGAMWSF